MKKGERRNFFARSVFASQYVPLFEHLLHSRCSSICNVLFIIQLALTVKNPFLKRVCRQKSSFVFGQITRYKNWKQSSSFVTLPKTSLFSGCRWIRFPKVKLCVFCLPSYKCVDRRVYDQLHALNSWHYGTNMKSILLMILSSLVSTFANPEGMIFLSAGIKIRLKQRLRFKFTLTWKKKIKKK